MASTSTLPSTSTDIKASIELAANLAAESAAASAVTAAEAVAPDTSAEAATPAATATPAEAVTPAATAAPASVVTAPIITTLSKDRKQQIVNHNNVVLAGMIHVANFLLAVTKLIEGTPETEETKESITVVLGLVSDMSEFEKKITFEGFPEIIAVFEEELKKRNIALPSAERERKRICELAESKFAEGSTDPNAYFEALTAFNSIEDTAGVKKCLEVIGTITCMSLTDKLDVFATIDPYALYAPGLPPVWLQAIAGKKSTAVVVATKSE